VSKTKALTLFAIIMLGLSAGLNWYQYSQYMTLDSQNDEAATKLEMQAILGAVQSQVNLELQQLDQSLQAACAQLSATDLKGDQARAILSALAQNNSVIINACTCDAKDVILAVEPSQYSGIEGEDISSQEQNLKMRQTMQPAMSEMILLVEGFYGVVMVAPIFNADGAFMGSLSIVIQPYDVLQTAIVPAIEGTPFAMWSMQVNGTLLYDPDPVQQGKNLFTDPIYVDYPTVQAFVQQVADQPSGYGTYQYHEDTVAGKLVDKEAYWATAGIYGAQWRLVILNVLST
jgi:hypothetical protein